MRKILTDPAITTVRIVLNLEKMVVKEAKRAFSYLSLFGYVTDAVIVNRLLPSEVHDELFKKMAAHPQALRSRGRAVFRGHPDSERAPLRPGDGRAGDAAADGQGDLRRPPAEHFATSSPQRIDKDGSDYVLDS